MTETPFSSLPNPSVVADFPVDALAAYVAGLPWQELDDSWTGPCYRSMDIHHPGRGSGLISWDTFLGWRNANPDLFRERLVREFRDAVKGFGTLLDDDGRILLLGLVCAPDEAGAIALASEPTCPGARLPFWRHGPHAADLRATFTSASLRLENGSGKDDWFLEADFAETDVD